MAFFRHSFEELSFRDVLAISRDHLSRIALLEVEPIKGDRLHRVGMEVRALSNLAVGRLWCSPARATRTKAHTADSNDNLVLVFPTNAELVISRAGSDETVCKPGEAYVWASDEPLSFAYGEDCTTLNLSLPRAMLAALAINCDDRVMMKIDPSIAPDLWLLRNYLTSPLEALELTDTAATLAAAHLCELAAIVLGSARNRFDPMRTVGERAARLEAIKADILANLTQPISVVEISARHKISPRYLRALFAAEQTSFTDFVLQQRLAVTKRLLANPRHVHRTIASIAYECGFNDLSYFNRVFRRRYAMTPSEARIGGARPGGA